MSDLVLAHGGHWYHSVLYVAPLLLTVVVLWWQGRAERRRDRARDRDAAEPPA